MCDHCGCRQYGPIAELTADHDLILELAWHVAEGDPVADDTWAGARDQLVALLHVHAVKEELGLYPLLIGTGDLDQELCDRLEAEHRDVHEVLGRGAFDRREYYALAAHIEQEEMELFPGARYAFDDREWDDMDEAHHQALHQHGVAHAHP